MRFRLNEIDVFVLKILKLATEVAVAIFEKIGWYLELSKIPILHKDVFYVYLSVHWYSHDYLGFSWITKNYIIDYRKM